MARPGEGREKLTIRGEEAAALLDRALVVLKRVCTTTSAFAVLCCGLH